MTYTNTMHRTEEVTGSYLMGSTFKLDLTAATWKDLFASSFHIKRPVQLMRVWVNASPTTYGLYVHRYIHGGTHIQRERVAGATNQMGFTKDMGHMALVMATYNEYINFRLGTPFTPAGRRGAGLNALYNKLNYMIVEGVPYE